MGHVPYAWSRSHVQLIAQNKLNSDLSFSPLLFLNLARIAPLPGPLRQPHICGGPHFLALISRHCFSRSIIFRGSIHPPLTMCGVEWSAPPPGWRWLRWWWRNGLAAPGTFVRSSSSFLLLGGGGRLSRRSGGGGGDHRRRRRVPPIPERALNSSVCSALSALIQCGWIIFLNPKIS